MPGYLEFGAIGAAHRRIDHVAPRSEHECSSASFRARRQGIALPVRGVEPAHGDLAERCGPIANLHQRARILPTVDLLSPPLRPLPRLALGQDPGHLGAGVEVMDLRIPKGINGRVRVLLLLVGFEPAASTDVIHEGHGAAIGRGKPAGEVTRGEGLDRVAQRGGPVELPSESPLLDHGDDLTEHVEALRSIGVERWGAPM